MSLSTFRRIVSKEAEGGKERSLGKEEKEETRPVDAKSTIHLTADGAIRKWLVSPRIRFDAIRSG